MTSWDLGGGGNSFSFDRIGDEVSGFVLDLIERQSTDMESGKPDYWDNGDPKMISVVTLQTELRDPNDPSDDGQRTIVLAGSKKPETESRMAAVIAAVKAATGAAALQYKGWLRMQYYADGEQTRKGFSAPKRYRAIYKAPAMELEQPPKPPPQTASQQINAQQGQQQQQWPPPNTGPAPGWAQQEPPPDPWAGQAGPPMEPPPAQQEPNAAWQQQQTPPPQAAAPVASSPATGAADPKLAPVTREQIAGLQAINVDPAQVYGPDWQSRLVD